MKKLGKTARAKAKSLMDNLVVGVEKALGVD